MYDDAASPPWVPLSSSFTALDTERGCPSPAFLPRTITRRKRDWSRVLSLPENEIRSRPSPADIANQGEVSRASVPAATLSPGERKVQAQVGSWASKSWRSSTVVSGGGTSRT